MRLRRTFGRALGLVALGGLVLRWAAHDAAATNLHFMDIETAQTAAEAVAKQAG